MKRRSFLTLAFRAAATVACLGVARVTVADGAGWEREPLWPSTLLLVQQDLGIARKLLA